VRGSEIDWGLARSARAIAGLGIACCFRLTRFGVSTAGAECVFCLRNWDERADRFVMIASGANHADAITREARALIRPGLSVQN
jgi:TctA family transporter